MKKYNTHKYNKALDVYQEEQEKNLKDHLAHLFVHGTLHLMGFDHKKKSERNKMETIEKRVLIKLGIDDPYS